MLNITTQLYHSTCGLIRPNRTLEYIVTYNSALYIVIYEHNYMGVFSLAMYEYFYIMKGSSVIDPPKNCTVTHQNTCGLTVNIVIGLKKCDDVLLLASKSDSVFVNFFNASIELSREG